MKFRNRKKSESAFQVKNQDENLLTKKSPFAVREAYKAMRTNLMFSIPGEKCRKILITSSKQHEGKSITAVNLGIAFAENQAKVLLVDCDLRMPTDAQKLQLKQSPGLTNLLIGLCALEDAVHHLPNGLDVLPAGDIPPNPSELLGSEEMQVLIEQLEQEYEYIIFDTPPVCTVTDAAILSKWMSGVVMVVRRNIADQESVAAALSQLNFAEAKLLGFVFNDALNEQQKTYKKYGYGYGYGYGYSYAQAHSEQRG